MADKLRGRGQGISRPAFFSEREPSSEVFGENFIKFSWSRPHWLKGLPGCRYFFKYLIFKDLPRGKQSWHQSMNFHLKAWQAVKSFLSLQKGLKLQMWLYTQEVPVSGRLICAVPFLGHESNQRKQRRLYDLTRSQKTLWNCSLNFLVAGCCSSTWRRFTL